MSVPNLIKKTFLSWFILNKNILSKFERYLLIYDCQAQPKPKLEAEMAIFSIVTTTHLATHPDKFKFGIRQHNSQKQSC